MTVRILMVANTLPPHDLSGVGEQVLQLAEGLRRRGHEVEVLGRGRGGARGPKVLFPLTVVRPCLRAVRRFQPDVVQVHESDGAFAVAALRRSRRRPLLVALLQVSYVQEREAVRPLVHGGEILGVPGPVERRFRRFKAPLQILLGRWTARGADLVLAPSAKTAEELAADYGVRRWGLVPNATGGLTPPVADSGGTVPDSDPDGPPPLLFVGRLRVRKGVEVLFEAVRRMADSGVPATTWIAGDGEHRAALERRAESLGLGPDRVRFLGRVSAAIVRDLLARAAALVVPSTYEGMPLVILEAMEAARPVVASRVSGIPEVVVDGETGWLVPPEDPPALERALIEALSDAGERERRGLAGRDRVRRLYRPEQAAELWEREVEKVRGRE
ncbi:MAG: glycosyltransferase family 4 protein [Acidobacteria bacterium]|nr:glycosyltransferase family 4 protein [Acidobacteriota bacterium]